MEINVLIDESIAGCPGPEWFREVTRRVLAIQGIDDDVELGLLVTTLDRIQELNRSYRQIDRPTDVLAFAMDSGKKPGEEPLSFVTPPDGLRHLGEIVLSCSQAAAQAREQSHSVERELEILLVHGVLHLLGYDHVEPEQERLMKAREAEILAALEGSF